MRLVHSYHLLIGSMKFSPETGRSSYGNSMAQNACFCQMKLLGKSQEVIEQMKEHSIPRFSTIPVRKKTHSPSPQILCVPFEKKTHLYPPFTTKQKPQKASSTLRVQLYVSAVMCWGIQGGETSKMWVFNPDFFWWKI